MNQVNEKLRIIRISIESYKTFLKNHTDLSEDEVNGIQCKIVELEKERDDLLLKVDWD